MKRIIYLLVFMGTIFMGCDPIQDIFDDLDAQENAVVGDDEITLTSEDYDDLDLDFENFNSVDEAKTLLPPFLGDRYPFWGQGSSVIVNYNLFDGNPEEAGDFVNADEFDLAIDDYAFSESDALASYPGLTSADFGEVLGFYPNIDPSDFFEDILEANFLTPAEGQIELVKYVQYSEMPVVSISTNFSIQEDFDYGGTAGDLTVASGGNWSVHSGSSAPVGYDTSSLSMTGYPNSGVGGSLTFDGSGSEDVNRAFNEISSGTVYASALVNLSAVGTGTYFFHVKDDGFDFSGRVGAKDDGAGKINFGIGASSSSLTYGTTPYDLNTTYLIVGSYNIDSGLSNLYVLTTPEATEPASPEATNSGSAGRLVSAVAVRQGFGGATGTIDGVRVATTWNGIMVNDVAVNVAGDKTNEGIYYSFNGSFWNAVDDVRYLTAADYDSMGEASGQPGRFNNFSSSTLPENYLPQFLDLNDPFAQEEDEIFIIYRFFIGGDFGTVTKGNLYTKTGGAWVPSISILQFGFDDGNWVPDNTIKHTFTSDDVAFISNAFINIYPGPADNFGFFGSFDRRSSSSNFWSDEMLLEAFNALLDNIDPSAAEGQKYALTYVIFNGSTTDETMNVIKIGGVWVLQ